MPERRDLFKAIGPGVLFAGAAIGVSHLVQSTQAGALYGLWMLPIVVLAHAAKYPAMVFGPRYAAATGRSLIEGYRDQGWHAVGIFGLIALGTSFTVLAAVTLVTAAVLRTALQLDGVSTTVISGGLLLLAAGLVGAGGFKWLDGILKGLMVILLLATLAAGAFVLPRLDLSILMAVPAGAGLAAIPFMVRLVGWMPAPLDITVWHSLWTLDRAELTRHKPTDRECRLDFNIGYALCVITACSFLLLGAVVMYQPGIRPSEQSGPFVDQLFALYTEALGAWIRPVIAVAASAVMLSTTLTVFDALPRAAEGVLCVATKQPRPIKRTWLYWVCALVISSGALAIIHSAKEWLLPLVNLATTLSFMGTPALAWFNHRAMTSSAVPPEFRPGRAMRALSLGGVILWTAFALLYAWVTFLYQPANPGG